MVCYRDHIVFIICVSFYLMGWWHRNGCERQAKWVKKRNRKHKQWKRNWDLWGLSGECGRFWYYFVVVMFTGCFSVLTNLKVLFMESLFFFLTVICCTLLCGQIHWMENKGPWLSGWWGWMTTSEQKIIQSLNRVFVFFMLFNNKRLWTTFTSLSSRLTVLGRSL